MIKFILISNKQGLTRFSNYYNNCVEKEERSYFEADIVRKCLSRNEKQCSFIEYKSFKIVYRRYASLFFIVGIDESEVDTMGNLVSGSFKTERTWYIRVNT